MHEGFQSSGGRAVCETKRVGNAGLENALKHFFGAVGKVVHFVPNAKKIIVGGGQPAVFRPVDHLVPQQVFHRAASFFEEGHPNEVLIVPQAAAAVFDVGLLHIGRVAEFLATQLLVFKPSSNVGFFPPVNAFGQQGLPHFVKKRFVSDDETGLNQGGLGLHVFVGHANAVRNGSGDGKNLEPNVGERAKESLAKIDQPLVFSAGGQAGAVVKHHDVQVAARAQLASSVASVGDDGQEAFVSVWLRENLQDFVEEMLHGQVQDFRPRFGDGASAAAAAMRDFEPMRFYFEKVSILG